MDPDSLATYRYENLSIPRLREILKTAPIALIPIGIMEWHGNQNALGMDGLVAENLCGRVMTQLKRGVLLPLHWVGTYGYVHYEGTVCYDEAVTAQFLTQLLFQVVKLGFKLIVLISGHGGKWQQTAINTAVQTVSKTLAKPSNQLTIIGVVYPELSPGVGVTHAGIEETAMLWRIGQIKGINLVDIYNVSSKPETLRLYPLHNEADVSIKEETLWNWKQIFPHPEQCNPELGEKLLVTFAAGILEEIKTCLEDIDFKLG